MSEMNVEIFVITGKNPGKGPGTKQKGG